MSVDELEALFERHNDEFLNFEKVESKKSGRSDLHAFLLLDLLVPSQKDIVAGAEHDEIYLGVNLDELAPVVTEAQVIELIRSGVRLDSHYGCLAMFV